MLFSHLTLCPSMSSLFPFFSPSNSTIVEIQTYVESEERSAFLIPFFSERSWGLVCAWVPRIMITAAEKHIFTFREIRAGNLQAEDLTSSLWLIVELTEKSQPNANTGLHHTLHNQEEHPLLCFPTVRDISHSDTPVAIVTFPTTRHPSLLCQCPISYWSG